MSFRARKRFFLQLNRSTTPDLLAIQSNRNSNDRFRSTHMPVRQVLAGRPIGERNSENWLAVMTIELTTRLVSTTCFIRDYSEKGASRVTPATTSASTTFCQISKRPVSTATVRISIGGVFRSRVDPQHPRIRGRGGRRSGLLNWAKVCGPMCDPFQKFAATDYPAFAGQGSKAGGFSARYDSRHWSS